MALNGQFPSAMLAYLGWPEADHLRLVPAAATSLTRLAAQFERDHGKPLYITDAYRTLAVQITLKVSKGVFAATPGTSNHGLGLAVDMSSRINVEGSAEHRWMEANGPHYGWVNPAWAVDYNPANGQHEPWHWEYRAALDRSADTKTTTALTTTPEDDMPLNDADMKRIRDDVRGVVREQLVEILRAPEFGTAHLTKVDQDWVTGEVHRLLLEILRAPEFAVRATGAAGVTSEQVADVLAQRLAS